MMELSAAAECGTCQAWEHTARRIFEWDVQEDILEDSPVWKSI